MSIQQRSRNGSKQRSIRKNRSKESSVRTQTREMLRQGRYDVMESRLPSRALRTA